MEGTIVLIPVPVKPPQIPTTSRVGRSHLQGICEHDLLCIISYLGPCGQPETHNFMILYIEGHKKTAASVSRAASGVVAVIDSSQSLLDLFQACAWRGLFCQTIAADFAS